MRSTLFLAAVASLAAPSTIRAADPPVVFQTQPVGRVIGDARATVQLVGGEKAVKEFNDSLKQTFGEKGFDGLDLARPIVGYVLVPENLLDSVAVVALPVTSEKDFLDLCERVNGEKPKALDGGLFELPSLQPAVKSVFKVANQSAYIATGRDPAGALAQANLVPANKLFDPTETSLATAKLHFDRLPPGTPDRLLAMIGELKGKFMGMGGLGGQELLILNTFGQLGTHAVTLSKDAKLATLRINLDPRLGDFSAEASLIAKPGTALEKLIAGKKPTTNKFAALVTPDAAVAFKASLPGFTEELRAAQATGFEELAKQIPAGSPAASAALDELFKGLVRTVKAGDFDIVGVVRGPDQKGLFTAVGAVAFEDAIPLEKAFRKFVDAEGPAEFKKNLKWDAAKAGTVNIHTVALNDDGGFIFRDLQKPFGQSSVIAFAFAPNGLFFAYGPDAVGTLKAALAVKPIPSPVVDVIVNPARFAKLAGAMEPGAESKVEEALGKDDKPLSVVSLTVEGGQELKVRLTVNVKVIGRAGVGSGSAKSVEFEKK